MNNQQESKPTTLLVNLFRLSRPLEILASFFFYALGAGVVQYLGFPINWTTYIIGQFTVIFLQLSSYYLKAYYDEPHPEENDSPVENKPDAPRGHARGQLPRVQVLQSAMVMMTIGAVLTVLLLASGSIQLPGFIFLGLAFLLGFLYAVPPVRLVYSGYGEFTNAVLIANLVPSLSYMYQTGDLHRILAMLTFPLTAMFMAAFLALSLRQYGGDMRFDRRTLMVRMGWQRGMNVHNILILFAYLMFALASVLGLPWVLTWPALLSLPIGLFEIYLVSQIARGSKPNWNLLSLTAVGMLGLTVYMLNLALWTH